MLPVFFVHIVGLFVEFRCMFLGLVVKIVFSIFVFWSSGCDCVLCLLSCAGEFFGH